MAALIGEEMRKKGSEVKTSAIECGYDINEEVQDTCGPMSS